MTDVTWRLTRRGFLVGMGVTGTTVALGIPFGLPVARRKVAAAMAGGFSPHGTDLNPLLWIEIRKEGGIRLFVPKAEMGQGCHTGLAQIAAEELEVPWGSLEVVHATTHQAEDKYRGTYGSMSISTLYEPLRRAAATMREMLKVEAAKRLAQPAEKLVARDGWFEVEGDAKQRISYAALVDKDTKWQMPTKPVALKSAEDFRLIGRPLLRVDGRAKVTGEAIFGHDVRAEGMLYGAVVRPPTIQAKMLAARPARAEAMPGVVKVVTEDDFVGVVARTRAQAAAARDAIEVDWDKGHPWQQDELEQVVTVGGRKAVPILREGDARSVLKKDTSLSAEYRTALVAHATLETQAALADVGPKGGKIWASTQAENMTAAQVGKALRLEPNQIELIPTFVGGGFGRKAGDNNVPTAAAEAARLSLAAGVPVQVTWDRSEEMRHGYVRPMTHHRLSAKIKDGRIEAMDWQEASGDSILGVMPRQEILARIFGFDPGATRGTWIYYDVPHRDITVWRRKMPLATGQWRGLGAAPNTFAIETFMDEAAHAAGKDPLAFRLQHLPDNAEGKRMAIALHVAAEKADWGHTPPKGRGRGIACCFYHGSLVAEVAEVSLEASSGRIRVHRVVAAMDCGRAVNPDLVRSQIEGCVVMGTSAALIEELTVKDGAIVAGNFDDYPLLTLNDAPEVEAIVLESPGAEPSGCGEPPIAPIAPAIGNAFFALTGRRLRQLPMSPERVKKALQS